MIQLYGVGPIRYMSISVQQGIPHTVHVQFGTSEVQFGTPPILQCNFGTPQGRFRYTFRSFSVHQQIIKIMTVYEIMMAVLYLLLLISTHV